MSYKRVDIFTRVINPAAAMLAGYEFATAEGALIWLWVVLAAMFVAGGVIDGIRQSRANRLDATRNELIETQRKIIDGFKREYNL